MKKVLIPSLLTLCAIVAVFSPWSSSALARAIPSADKSFTNATAVAERKPEFAFSRGGYRHAMPTWQR